MKVAIQPVRKLNKARMANIGMVAYKARCPSPNVFVSLYPVVTNRITKELVIASNTINGRGENFQVLMSEKAIVYSAIMSAGMPASRLKLSFEIS